MENAETNGLFWDEIGKDLLTANTFALARTVAKGFCNNKNVVKIRFLFIVES